MANILHEMQTYNTFLSSFDILLHPIEWPECSSIGEALKEIKRQGDISETHSVASSRMRKFKKSSKRLKHGKRKTGAGLGGGLESDKNLKSVTSIDRHMLDRAFILLLSITHQLKRIDKDLQGVLLDGDIMSKGFLYPNEFKRVMDRLGIAVTEDDIIILAKLSDFLKRLYSRAEEEEDD